ncbi:MAG: flagellin, partial [Campylobacterales bacterium]
NYLSNFTLTQLHNTENNLNKVVTQLSSGRRIVTAADDVSGFNIVQRLTRVSKGIEQGMMNAQDGISLAQVALAATQQMIDNYQVVRQKALQAANETVNPDERKQISVEIAKIIEAMDQLAKSVDFNEYKLFDSTTLKNKGVHSLSKTYTLSDGTTVSVQMFQFMIQYGPAAKSGATSFGATGTGDNRIFAPTFTDTVFSRVLGIQIKDQDYLKIASNLQTTYGFGVGSAESKMLGFAARVQDLINILSDQAANMGSTINQLNAIVAFNEQAKTTIDESASRIRDVDFAKATAQYQQLQILMQSGTAMLAQANQLPQFALKLIG